MKGYNILKDYWVGKPEVFADNCLVMLVEDAAKAIDNIIDTKDKEIDVLNRTIKRLYEINEDHGFDD